MLVRVDAIGDYILFRNFIEILKKSEKYKSYSLTLVGNQAWKDLAVTLDGAFIDSYIWINRKKFRRNIIYRYKKLRDISSIHYEMLISPTFSREFFYNDHIVKVASTDQKIGCFGDFGNIRKWQKRIGDKFYNILICVNEKEIFEFNKNKRLFEIIIKNNILLIKPKITTSVCTSFPFSKLNYAVLFIGASHSQKKWHIKNFAKIARFLVKRYGLEIVLCGSSEDKVMVKKFEDHYRHNFYDLVGKTNLLELSYILSEGKLLLSNDTLAPHIAVAHGKGHVFVVYSGNHFGRFIPYPKDIYDRYDAICHPVIENNPNEYLRLCKMYGYRSGLSIDKISPETVIERISNQFNLLGSKSSFSKCNIDKTLKNRE